MKRRSKAGGKTAKPPHRKTVKSKQGGASHSVSLHPLSSSSKTPEIQQFIHERDEALEQQAATLNVLQLISRSQGDLQPIFAVILENATRLCQASFGALYLCEGDAYRTVAMHNAPPAFVEARKREPLVSMTGSTVLARVAKTKRAIHVADMSEDPANRNNPQNTQLFVRLAGARSAVLVPMLKNDELVGTIVIFRQQVRPFTDRQIELVQSFAAQAVIAIENARLLNELRQRTIDLTGSLEQQTATSEVLQVISSSPSDLEPVFATMLERAVRIGEAAFGNIYRFRFGTGHLVATYNTPQAFAEERRKAPDWRPAPESPVGRLLTTKSVVHVTDLASERAYVERLDAVTIAGVELGGVRTVLFVPMLKEKELIGYFGIARQEVRPFTDKQIDLVQNFAAQAVIAIENARLLNELRQRTADLTESLEQQTATSEVLQVISNSPGEVEPAFAAMLERAARICNANFGNIFRWDGEALRLVAAHNTPPGLVQQRSRSPFRPEPTGPLGRMLETKTVVHIADLAAEISYREQHQPGIVAAVELGGVRTNLLVPMLKEGELVGVFSLYRQEVWPFTDKQIELVENFAAQAVIAIENARLLNELRQRTTDLTERTADLTEALEQQTATSEVLQVISSSPGDLQPVFAALLERATQLCDAAFATLWLRNGEQFHAAALHGAPPAYAEIARKPACPLPSNPLGRMLRGERLIVSADVADEEPYRAGDPVRRALVDLAGARSAIQVALVNDDVLLGSLTVYRQEVRPFTDKQIALLQNFASQAVIAIENARLLKELRERTEEVEKLNQRLEQRVADQVGEIERMGRLRRFLPPQVADLIVASGNEKQLESHRREITALFCDLRGFTGFTESADAEDVMALLRDYRAAIGNIIIKYNGTLERYAGDGVMVVFNDPVPVENPPLQAVLMALEVREAIGALTSKWRRFGHDIGFGIGIAHGYATLGTIGFEGRFDYAAIGTVSNVASRLCDEAKPGQILISPRVLVAVENAVEVEPVGEFELKGIRRPLAAYNVIAALA